MKTFIALLASATTIYAQYAINPNSVSNSTRQQWCTQQQTQCPLICLQTSANSAETDANDCDWQSLTYACVCSNGLSPNVSEYSQTLPYFICTEWGNQCVSNCNGNADCQTNCRTQHPCGAQHPTLQNTSTLTSTMMSSTTTAAASDVPGQTTDAAGQTIYSGFGGAAATSSGSGGNGNGGASSGAAASHVRVWALSAGQTFGSLALVGGLIGGFAVLL